MKYKIVIVPFPFDDLSSSKARPAVCLTDEIQPYGHIVLAFITSRVAANPSATDFVIDLQNADFAPTGLKVSSTVRLHRLMTVSSKLSNANLASYRKVSRRKSKTACGYYSQSEKFTAEKQFTEKSAIVADLLPSGAKDLGFKSSLENRA